jgi:hypothetical protein
MQLHHYLDGFGFSVMATLYISPYVEAVQMVMKDLQYFVGDPIFVAFFADSLIASTYPSTCAFNRSSTGSKIQ